jgi:hypothetical protein
LSCCCLLSVLPNQPITAAKQSWLAAVLSCRLYFFAFSLYPAAFGRTGHFFIALRLVACGSSYITRDTSSHNTWRPCRVAAAPVTGYFSFSLLNTRHITLTQLSLALVHHPRRRKGSDKGTQDVRYQIAETRIPRRQIGLEIFNCKTHHKPHNHRDNHRHN